MVLNTKEASANNADWSTFEKAWKDARLSDDSLYGSSMNRWLKEFDLDKFVIIDSDRLKSNPQTYFQHFLLIQNNHLVKSSKYIFDNMTFVKIIYTKK